MNKKMILSGLEVKKDIFEGIKKSADAIGSTLGPAGRKVAIKEFSGIRLTKDGVSVAQSIELGDELENTGASLVKQVANNTLNSAGDGTSSASVLFKSMVQSGIQSLNVDMNPVQVAQGMKDALKIIKEELSKNAINIQGNQEKAKQLATVASGDEKIGEMIAKAAHDVGPYGLITVDDAKSINTSLETSLGAELSNGYLSGYFINNQDKNTCELDEPYILVCDYKIGAIEQIVHLLDPIAKQGRPLLIIADDVDGTALRTLVLNAIRGAIKVCAIKSPGFGDNKKHTAEDIAVLTGAKYISKEITKLEDISVDDLGVADKIVVHKDKTIIVGGRGNETEIEQRREQISDMIKDAPKYEKDNLEKRQARLSKGVAIIRVGDVTAISQKELKDRVEDAVLALKSALKSGVLPGGGVSLVYAEHLSQKLYNNSDDKSYIEGVTIVFKALKAPFIQNLHNAGKKDEAMIILNKLISSDNKNMGYDSLHHKVSDMIEAGIIDSLNSVISGIEYATYMAVEFLTSEAFILDDPKYKEEKTDGTHAMPSMGGMY